MLLNTNQIYAYFCYILVPLLVLRFEPDPYLSMTSITPGFDNCVREPSSIGCSPPTLLSNGNTGPVNPDLSTQSDGRQFVAWTGNTNNYLSLTPTSASTTISAINLYMYINPSQGVGLPNIKLYGMSSTTKIAPTMDDSLLQFNIINNDQISQLSNTVILLTLHLESVISYPTYLIVWDYNNLLNTDWFIMSEVSLCNDPPTTVPSTSMISFSNQTIDNNAIITPQSQLFNNGSLTVTCSVTNEGNFMWRWRKGPTTLTNNDPGTTILTADATRTSILTIPASSGIYFCDVSYTTRISYYGRTFSVAAISKFMTIIAVFT